MLLSKCSEGPVGGVEDLAAMPQSERTGGTDARGLLRPCGNVAGVVERFEYCHGEDLQRFGRINGERSESRIPERLGESRLHGTGSARVHLTNHVKHRQAKGFKPPGLGVRTCAKKFCGDAPDDHR